MSDIRKKLNAVSNDFAMMVPVQRMPDDVSHCFEALLHIIAWEVTELEMRIEKLEAKHERPV